MKRIILTLIFGICCFMQILAIAISTEHIGNGKWVTLKTENGYFFYAIEENGVAKLGQTQSAPNSENYAAYCWKIEGDETNGYTFRCLKYEEQGKKYITNPTTLATNSQEVLLTEKPSRYIYTDKHQLQLVDNTNLYLAFYSWKYSTIRLHNSNDYIGSRMIIGGIYDWSVAAIVYGTETIDGNGIITGTTVPNGGVIFNGVNYTHTSNFYVNGTPNCEIIPVTGFEKSTIKIDEQNKTIVAYYLGTQSGVNYKTAGSPAEGQNAITGENNTIWTMTAKNYITNTSGNYDKVPADKAWQMEMVVENTTRNGNDPSFNRWGSCILSSCGDPLNTYYWGDFQVYQHAPTHTSPNTLNFKSNKGDGMDHIIAQGNSVANKNYKVIVRYNGNKVYVIRTIMLDDNFNETNEVYNNVWIAAQSQKEINQMSCALPTGINLKSLKISIAEESNLLEDVDYAIQNIGTKYYLNGQETSDWYSLYAGDAAKYQIKWTGNQDLTYSETDGGLHNSFYIKSVNDNKWLTSNNKFTGDQEEAQAFVYTTDQRISPITAKNTTGNAWAIETNNTWYFDFFANFYVEVAGNNNGGLNYHKNGEPQTAHNNTYLELPSGVDVSYLSNSSQIGYSAAISKADIRIKVQYTPLDDTFYYIEPLASTTNTNLYYWDKSNTRLITYNATQNTLNGNITDWDDKGDVSKFAITKANEIPVKLSLVEGKYYGSIYCPNALVLPDGVNAYTLTEVTNDGIFKLKSIEGNVLPKRTGAVLISNNETNSNFAINTSVSSAIEYNLFNGSVIRESNPNYGKTNSNIYVLGSKNGIGFYQYTGEKIPAFKAYYVDSLGAAKSFAFSFEENSSTTGISELTSENSNTDIYDLTGRKVKVMLPGQIYIINNKKIIFK